MHICAAFSIAFRQIFCLRIISSAFPLIVSTREGEKSRLCLKALWVELKMPRARLLVAFGDFFSPFLLRLKLFIDEKIQRKTSPPSISTSHFTSNFCSAFMEIITRHNARALSATTIHGHLVNCRLTPRKRKQQCLRSA